MGSYLRKQIDGEDAIGPRNRHAKAWPRRCMVCRTVHDLGECPVGHETERRMAEWKRESSSVQNNAASA